MSTKAESRPTKRHTTAQERRALRLTAAPVDERALYPIDLALVYLDTSRKTFYFFVKAGNITLHKRGRRSYVLGSDLLSPIPAAAAAA